METTLRGVGVSHGVAIGEVRHMGTAVLEPPAKQIPAEEAEREQGRARKAVEAVAADLMARGNLAGGEAQAVLEAQAMMAQDPELMADVERRIAVGSTAESWPGVCLNQRLGKTWASSSPPHRWLTAHLPLSTSG